MKKKLLILSVLAVCLSLNENVAGASSWGMNDSVNDDISTGWGDGETNDNIDSDVVITPNPPDITVNETTGELSIYGTEKIYYAIDNNEWIEYSSPITLSDGIHQVLAYQVNSEGIESSTTENEVWITTEATINADDEEDFDNLEDDVDTDTDDDSFGDGNIDDDNINDDFDGNNINNTDDNVEDNTNDDDNINDDINNTDDNVKNDINDDNNDFSSDDSNISDIITIGGNDFDNDDTDYDYSDNNYNDSYDTDDNNDDNDEKLPQTGSVLNFDNLGILLCGAAGTLLAYGKKKL